MQTTIIFLYILWIHFIGDFIFQRDEDAKAKSKSLYHLHFHTVTYSLVWLIAIYAFGKFTGLHITFNDALLFTAITFVTHTFIDFFTSKLTTYYFGKKDFHRGFCVIGFDQILHYMQLYFLFYWMLANI